MLALHRTPSAVSAAAAAVGGVVEDQEIGMKVAEGGAGDENRCCDG